MDRGFIERSFGLDFLTGDDPRVMVGDDVASSDPAAVPAGAPVAPASPNEAAFTANNVVVYRVGTGAAALSSAATAAFLDEFTGSGTLVQSIALPTADSGANQTLTASGTATSEGMLTRSADGRYLILTGYDAAVGTASVNTSTSAAAQRVIGRVDASGNVDTSTTLGTAFSGGNIRGAASLDGSSFWATGSVTGVINAAFGATSSTVISTTATNLRGIDVYDGQLYTSSASGALRLGTVGVGTPTTTGQTITNLPGFPTTGSGNSPYQFFFADLTAAVAGVDTLYVTDDRATASGGGLLKYSLVGGSWVLNGTASGGLSTGLRGLAGSVSNTTVSFYATTTQSSANQLVSLIDTGGYNAAFSNSTFTVVATAAANTAFRGVAFAPQAAAQPGSLAINDVSHNEGNSGSTDFTFTVTRTGGSAGAVSANWALAHDTTDAADFTAYPQSGTVNFADGETTKTITITVAGDTVVEGNDTFFVNLTNPTGGVTIADGQGQGTILNDDSVVVSAANASVAEGSSGTTDLTFTVSLNTPSTDTVTVNYATADGTALAGSDYTATSGTLTFLPGETSHTVTVTVAGDTVYEANETLALNLSSPTNATLGTNGAGTIVNDDAAPTLAIGNATVVEGDSGTTTLTYTVTLTGSTALTTTVNYATANGSATAGTDYLATSGTLTFAPGETTKTISVTVNGDTTFEQNETVLVNLTAPTNATVTTAQGVGTITNDDVAPPAANIWINEIHYDNAGTDAGEAVEIAGKAGTDLSGYTLVFYNGSNTPGAAPTYMTTNLTGVIDDEGSGYGAVSFSYPANGIQNGVADGIALISPAGVVVQLLSYEGTFTAAAGTPAAGVTSTDIGVSEDGSGAIGASLQLTGNGAASGDFSWQPDATSSFGSLNVGQTIIPDNATGQVSVADASVVEGNAGTSNLVFTVHRAGGLGSAASVDYAINLDGTADANDIAAGAVFSGTVNFAVGASTATVTVPIQGDTVGEANETLSLHLSNPQGNIAITDADATGTITNDDFVVLSIAQIQGAGHTSPYVGQPVQTTGIVTAVDTNGFYMQMAVGDGDSATSDGIFVFTSTAPTVVVGDGVTVGGTVTEFAGDAAGLTLTQIASPTVTVDSHGNALPAAILIGTGGVLPPSQNLDDDHLTTYDPVHDGLDFWESLEGMRVTIDAPQVVSNTNSYGETDVVASHGVGASGVNARGGITISPNGDGTVDYNPEKIQIDDDSGVFSGYQPNYTIGDQLSSVTGIVNYSFDYYEVVVTQAVSVTRDQTLTRETTTIQGNADYLTLATYNLENLDASDNKYDILASDIVYRLKAPDILAVQEVQDADGAGSGTDLSGVSNAQGIIDAIFALTGQHYAYIEIAPDAPNTTGGEPNGNIRSGYFYNTDRVSYVAGSAELITGAAYNNSRKPLVATWTFLGQNITTIDVHLTSRGGSEPMQGADQPASAAGDAQRTAQAAGVKAYVNAHLADNPNLNIAVLGDWNGFYFETAQTQLTDPNQGGQLTNVNYLLSPEERYSYEFEGNAQQIDNILVSANLLSKVAGYDAVHLNSEFGGTRPTDHDPQITVFKFGSGVGDSFFGTDGDNIYTVDNAADRVYENPNGGNDTIFSSVSYSLVDAPNVENLTLTGNLGLTGTGNGGDNVLTGNGAADSLFGGDGNDTIVIGAANSGSTLDGGTGTDTLSVSGAVASLAGVSGFEAIQFNAGASLELSAGQLQDGFATNTTLSGNGTLIVDLDPNVALSVANFTIAPGSTVTLVANGSADGDYIKGLMQASNTLNGGGGEDFLRGGQLADVIDGGTDRDKIAGLGGADTLTGGDGPDQFRYLFVGDSTPGAGADHITDFVAGTDKIDFRLLDSDTNTPDIQLYNLTFVGSAAFSAGGQGEIHTVVSGADLLVEVDVDGNGSADMQIVLDNAAGQTLTSNDFLLDPNAFGATVAPTGGVAGTADKLAVMQGWIAAAASFDTDGTPTVGIHHFVDYLNPVVLPANDWLA